MNYTLFCDVLKQSGEEIGINREPITSARLHGVRNYVTAGPVQPFSPGKGKVVVVSDDAAFADKFIDSAGNRRLAENITRWFRQ